MRHLCSATEKAERLHWVMYMAMAMLHNRGLSVAKQPLKHLAVIGWQSSCLMTSCDWSTKRVDWSDLHTTHVAAHALCAAF